MTTRLEIGSAEIFALTDAEGPFFTDRAEAFPTVSEEQWREADAFAPGAATDDGRWWLQFRAFAVRAGGKVTIVDAGIGPEDSPAAGWAPVPGRLPERLENAGIEGSGILRGAAETSRSCRRQVGDTAPERPFPGDGVVAA